MRFDNQERLRAVMSDIRIPNMALIRQVFPDDEIKNVETYLRDKLNIQTFKERIKPGMKVVLTGSSRQIDNMPLVLKVLAAFVREQGASPVIIPAMGSHGGATDEGQKQMLETLGITEEACQCPIFSSMETVQVGTTSFGNPVRMDRFAHGADAIIIVGRIKGHTAFRGTYESGLVKMIAIGLGKRAGADSVHDAGFGEVGKRLPEYAKIISENCNIIFGVGMIENEHDKTCRIEVVPSEEIFDKEPDLLLYAKSRMPKILLPETDVLIVREIGKNFSGSGMDPNVTGTFGTPFATGGIKKQRVAVLDISDESHGNFIGLGKADVTTMRAYDKLDTESTYFNMITSTVLGVGQVPMVLRDDELAIRTAIKVLNHVDKTKVRIVYIKNTLSLETIMISETLMDEAQKNDRIEILEQPRPLRFTAEGELLDFIE